MDVKQIETKRLINRVILGGALAFLATLALAVYFKRPFGEVLPFCAVMGAAAALTTYMFWKNLVKTGETRLKGLLYGGAAGFIALYLAGLLMGLGTTVMMIPSDEYGLDEVWSWFQNSVMVYPIFVARVGGLAAVPIGAIAGFAVSKNKIIETAA